MQNEPMKTPWAEAIEGLKAIKDFDWLYGIASDRYGNLLIVKSGPFVGAGWDNLGLPPKPFQGNVVYGPVPPEEYQALLRFLRGLIHYSKPEEDATDG